MLPTIVGMGAVTFAVRLLPILLLERVEMPPLILRALRYVPPAVLSAIIFPELLVRDGALDLTVGNVRLLAGVVAAIVAWRSRSVILTIAVGMAILWLLQSLAF
jgi:branched-subunit amino acid transport protein